MKLQHFPLAAYKRAVTNEVPAACRHLSKFFCPHRLLAVRTDAPIDFRHHSLEIGENSISYLRYGQEVEIWPQSFNHFYLVTVVINGSMKVKSSTGNDTYQKQQMLVLNPCDQISMRWSRDCETITLRIESAFVDRVLLSELGMRNFANLHFNSQSRIGEHGNIRIRNMINFLVREIDFFSATETNPISSSAPSVIQDIVTHLGVYHLDDTSLQGVQPVGSHARSCYVRRAERLLRTAPETVSSVPSLAELVGARVRTLQIHCMRELQTSPGTMIANAKLDLIRTTLVQCPPRTTVTSAAIQSGWTQLGKLGAAYKRRYGELPSDTLKKVRSALG
ncbi:MAG TPA: AraC family transcriptional regulator [Xanthomonadales bacterium]|nr:AraC family transcriptional regulator [Xanthomonadales bacterium]